jgi:hypothetical protein
MSANIFISFAAQDRKVAITLCQALESRGFQCWISSRDILPGENFQIAIVRAIRKAKLMLLVFTANSNNSEEMNKELALASQQKLTVVPLRIEDVAPNDAFAYEFATRQWIDFFADWELAMGALASQIANVLGPDAPPLTPPVAAAAAVVMAPTARVEAPKQAEPEPEALAPVVVDEVPVEPEPVAVAEPEPEIAAEPVAEPPMVAAEAEVAAPQVEGPDVHAEPEAPVYSTAAKSVDVPASEPAPAAKKGSPLPLIIGAVVVLAAAAVAGVVLMGKKPSAATPAVAASTAAAPAGPTVTVAPTAASPAAVATQTSADTATGESAATAAPDVAAGQKSSRRHPKADAQGPAPLRASRSDIPY